MRVEIKGDGWRRECERIARVVEQAAEGATKHFDNTTAMNVILGAFEIVLAHTVALTTDPAASAEELCGHLRSNARRIEKARRQAGNGLVSVERGN